MAEMILITVIGIINAILVGVAYLNYLTIKDLEKSVDKIIAHLIEQDEEISKLQQRSKK